MGSVSMQSWMKAECIRCSPTDLRWYDVTAILRENIIKRCSIRPHSDLVTLNFSTKLKIEEEEKTQESHPFCTIWGKLLLKGGPFKNEWVHIIRNGSFWASKCLMASPNWGNTKVWNVRNLFLIDFIPSEHIFFLIWTEIGDKVIKYAGRSNSSGRRSIIGALHQLNLNPITQFILVKVAERWPIWTGQVSTAPYLTPRIGPHHGYTYHTYMN